jgi:uncharacterized membrane protein YeaQ/YmgE (transglycosylase-associated protein family)
MGFILAVALGAVLGWIASIVVRADAQQHILRDILVGIIGALLGCVVLGPVLGGGNILEATLDMRSLLVAALGSLALLSLLHLFRRRRKVKAENVAAARAEMIMQDFRTRR